MEYTQITLNDWLEMKQKLRQELIGVKHSFVRIGYALRKIEEQKLYEQDGYKSIAEFAQTEYGLGPSITSRFISINREYSVGGCSERLRPEYAELGRSQLEEMLKLPDSDRQMIQPEASREDIRDLKRFNKTEPAAGVADDIKSLVEMFYKDNPSILNEVFCNQKMLDEKDSKRLVDIVNPSGNRSYKKGLFFLMLYDSGIKIKKFGGEPFTMSWDAFLDLTVEIFGGSADGSRTYTNHFGIELPTQKEESVKARPKESIAPAQKPEESPKSLSKEPLPETAKTKQNEGEKAVKVEKTSNQKQKEAINASMEEEVSEKSQESQKILSGAPTREDKAEAAGQTEPEVVDRLVNRIEFLKGLSAESYADYLAKQMSMLRKDRYLDLNKETFWIEWLQKRVDREGEEEKE